MSTILKAASAMSLALTTAAALSVTDVSFAFESADDTPETQIIVDPAMLDSEPQAIPPVVFAEPQEVVADIPEDVIEADARANGASEEKRDWGVHGFVDNGAKSLRELVQQQSVPGQLTSEMECLAGTVYFESKGESLAGQLAVARVVLARAESSRFPNSICGVVYQPKQFSFVRGGKMPRINKAHRHWSNAVAIAKIAVNNAWKSEVEGALFFHARYVSPGWRLRRMARIDNHIFYR